jgi:hypothetical protein
MVARTGSVGAAIIALILFALSGCSDAVAPDSGGIGGLEPAFAPGGGKGKPGGGDGDGGPTAGNVITRFADAPGDAIRSDGQGDYVSIKKKQEVESEISTSGQHGLKMEVGPANREVCVGFPAAGPDAVILSATDWADLVTATDGAVDLGQVYCSIITMHTRDHTDPDKLLGMDTDPTTATILDVQMSGGKLVLKDVNADQSWEWRLLYDDSHTTVNGGADDNGLCILYRDDGTWLLGNDPGIAAASVDDPNACDGLIDEYVNLIRVTDGGTGTVYTHVATFRMPFSYEVIPE